MDRYDPGDIVRLGVTFDDDGTPVDPDTVVLITRNPDGVDAEHQPTRDDVGVYHVDLQPPIPGAWGYRWVSTGPGQGAEPGSFHVRPEFHPAYRPTLPQVAAKLRGRLFDAGGGEQRTFTGETTPTAGQADEAVDQAVAAVLAALPTDTIPTALVDQARAVMALRAVMEIDLSYFPDQTTAQASGYEHWRDLYQDDLKRLIAAIRDQADGTRDGAAGGMPTHTFPPACPPLEW